MDSTLTKRRGFEKIKLVIKLLIMVIFLGYMMIWVMMPTNTFWMHWLPDMQAMDDSTFLGKQGLCSNFYNIYLTYSYITHISHNYLAMLLN